MRARTLHENLVHFGGVQFTTSRGLYVPDGVPAGVQFGPVATAAAGWADITAPIELRGTGANDPNFVRNLGGGKQAAYQFGLNDECWLYYHIPHDIVPSSPVRFHVHWKTSGSDTTNEVKFEWNYAFGRGFGQEAMNMAGTDVSASQPSAGAWYQMVLETDDCIIPNLTEPDGILEVYLHRVTNGATEFTDPVYVTVADVHYQSTGIIATKNRAPNFYS